MKKLYLVDVSSMFFRAFYAIPPLTNSSGLPTNALYGFLAMSIKLLREEKPDYMAFCFDRKEPSFRAELYEDYKANRSEMPEQLEPQIPYIRTLTEKLGVVAIDKKNYEADDVIGALAKLGEKEGLEVSIVSGDKDFAQLVNDKITLYDTMKNVRYDRAGVIEKWGVPPEKIIDYLSIVGDTSDNIPGVRGIGPKGALKLLQQYKDLEDIYKHVDEITPEGAKTKLIESKKAAFLAKKLVTIHSDIDVGLSIEDLKLKPIDKEDLKKILDELEFTAFLRKIFPEAGDVAASSAKKNEAKKAKSDDGAKSSKKSSKKDVGTKNDMVGAVSSQLSTRVGTSTNALAREQWSLSELKSKLQPYEEIWAIQNERGFCLGVNGSAIQVDGTLEEIGQVLTKKNLQWKGFDIKSVWRNLRCEAPSQVKWDSMLAGYILKAGDNEDFSKLYELHTQKTLPDLAGPEDILACNIELYEILSHKLADTSGQRVFETLELPLVPVLYDMERRGVLLDTKELKAQSETLTRDIASLEKQIQKIAGENFNVASPKQLGHILFEKMGIPSGKKTKTGYSTDSDVLSKLAPEYPICQNVIDFRELSKLKSTYVDALPTLVDAKDHRLHTYFHQALTQTGRLSSTNPNLQNIPIRTERGRLIRRAFVPQKDHFLLSIDYSQIELRVLAEITGDKGLCEAFSKNLDIHAATAAEVFGVDLDKVTPEQRRMAKAVNFGIAYGQGVFGLAETLEISRNESREIIESYFRKFSKVKDYMLDTVNVAKEQGYVESLFGRRRYLPELKSSNNAVQKFGERAAINAPIQGTASDLMKKAMISVYENAAIPMLLQVHDELLFESPKDSVEENAQAIREMMESVANFKVPLRANVAWGVNWEDAHA